MASFCSVHLEATVRSSLYPPSDQACGGPPAGGPMCMSM